MRLRTLLLGSAAAVFAVGPGALPANAADPVAGLVVTPTTMAEYLASCGGMGIQFQNICLSLEAGATLEFGFGYEIDYDETGPAGNTVVLVDDHGLGIFEWEACLEAEAVDPDNGHTVTFGFPIGFGPYYDDCNVEIEIETAGGFVVSFTTNSDGQLEFEMPTGFGTFTLEFDDVLTFNQWFNLPTLTYENAFGPVELEIGNDFNFDGAPIGIGDDMMFDPWIEATAEFGDATTFILGARTEINDFSGTNMWDLEALAAVQHSNGFDITAGGFFDFVDIGGRVPAFGAFAAAGTEFGPVGIEGGIGWARNTGFDLADDYADVGGFRDSPYDLAVGQSQFAAFLELTMAAGAGEVEWTTTFNTVPAITDGATLHTGLDYTLPVNMFTEFTAGVEFQTDLGNGNRAFQYMFGIEVALPD